MKKTWNLFTLLLIGMFIVYACGKNEAQPRSDSTKKEAVTIHKDSTKTKSRTRVTFIELGSVNCIPCKMMQPVMKAVEEEFGEQLEVVFYDVWKDNTPAKKYGIRLIPTQIFLNESGKEFFRHEGFFPKEEIEKLLIAKGFNKIEKQKSQKDKSK